MTVRYVAFGAGDNSTALVLGMYERGIAIDAILFADTGGELPHTYRHVEAFSAWCAAHGLPPVTSVRASGETLEENCLRRRALPAIAYGYKTCSQRWKSEPQEKWCNHWEPARLTWSRGDKVEKAIGYHADEPERAKPYEDDRYRNRYYLVDWGWGVEECIEAMKRHAIAPPGKSSCYFCPNRSDSEFRQMRETYPEHLERAIAMEENAELTSIKGLKRDYTLRQLLANEELFSFERPMPCMCVDG